MSVFSDKLAGRQHDGSAAPAESSLWSWDNTNLKFVIRALATAIAHAITSAAHTATAWRVFYSNGSGVVTELALGAANTFLRSEGAAAAPTFATVSTTITVQEDDVTVDAAVTTVDFLGIDFNVTSSPAGEANVVVNGSIASIYNIANQSITNATETVLTWDTELYDTDNYHSTISNTGRLTVPRAGRYLLTLVVFWATNTTGNRIIRIRVNGAGQLTSGSRISGTGNTTAHAQEITRVVNAATNDYFEALVYQDSGGALDAFGNSTSVELIRSAFEILRLGD